MGRGSPAEPSPFRWPPYSPDLTPCDFFLWGYLKSRIYRTQPADLNELRQRIVHEFENLPGDMVLRSIDSYGRRLERCLEVEGKSVEQSYGN
uniref:Transposase n=1 Tax=Ditylenchus dipsaci TaxID=166011 RepID=A0A915EH83_9BILA